MKIITNNPPVQELYPQMSEFVDSDVKDILFNVRNYIHLGAKLISYPQSGSLSLNDTPYKSIVLEEHDDNTGTVTDFYSLTLIENAIEQLKEPPKDITEYDEKILEDYKVIDLDMIKSCIDKL